MPVPLPPESLGDLQSGPFSFYPAIIGIHHNEWLLRSATWTEVQVVNTQTGDELFIPRRFLGELARIEAPVMIVGLLRELEYKEGALIPHRRRVIEMPRAVNGSVAMTAPEAPATAQPPARLAPVVAIRTEPDPPSRSHRLFRGSVALGILACVAAGFILRDATPRYTNGWYRTNIRPVDLSTDDDYSVVVEKLGRPSSDQWLPTSTGSEYRRLAYPRRGVAVILAGPDRASARYVGMQDLAPRWR